eukprot:60477-Pleurochrysis_carterae.AAC.1
MRAAPRRTQPRRTCTMRHRASPPPARPLVSCSPVVAPQLFLSLHPSLSLRCSSSHTPLRPTLRLRLRGARANVKRRVAT